MKVFISWSGKTSRQIAESFRELLPYMFERIQPFASFEDIKKGEQGIQKILQELENSKFGIICLTQESLNSPWLNFEAGALAKTRDSQLYTFLFGITRQDLNFSPLRDFQSTYYDKADVKQLMKTMNENYDSPLNETIFNNKFDDFWIKLSTKLDPIYESLKKNVTLILEEQELVITQEINDIKSIFSNLNLQTYLIEDIKNISLSSDLIIYVYSKSHQSKDKLQQIVDYIKTQTQQVKPSLIIYTLDNKRLEGDEWTMAKDYIFANFPQTLIERCKEVLK
ncbi:toll/interleukin-1 receptor domain-containing protein [Gloeothece verrucosa]|uniref:TIR domain-containing protein n=1 Tax=Gloeothece verrucosa (strain PCC 7822) TaxID=497965 RepID=E0UMM1_GLOV7|nr:toll/interleukin-1 receptor domain-containing protein [Gloeothece verrucosa]ADN18201.1 conserved hypothetical protein [Gloeothece verrucosa PCC 7822]